jgi:hypothetical protein
MGHKAQCASAILDGYSHDTSAGQTLPQVAAIVLCAESASVDKYHHGQGFAFLLGRSYYTEVQAVLAHHIILYITLFGLRGPLGCLGGFEHTLPRQCGLWSLASKVAYGRSCIGDGIITGKVFALEHSFQIACFYMGF